MKTKKKKGFTLTELIVVIVIIGVLAAVLIPSLTGYITKAQNSNDETLVTLLNQELEHQKLLNDDLEFYTAYDVNAFLKEVNRENIEVANKKSIILFDTEINQFVLVKEDEQSKALFKTEFVYHISEYYSIDHDYYDESNPQEVKLGYSKLSNSKCDKVGCKTHRAFIVSTNGPEIAKAVKAVMDLPIDNNGSNVLEVLKELDTDTYKMVISSITKTMYLTKTEAYYYDSDLNKVIYDNSKGQPDEQKLTRVIILPEVDEVDFNLINKLANCVVTVPETANTVETEKVNLASGSVVIGNTNTSDEIDYDNVYKTLNTNEENFIDPYVYNEAQLYERLSHYEKKDTNETVIIMKSFTVRTEINIPINVTLFIPYDDSKTNLNGYNTNKNIPESVNVGLKNTNNNASHGFAKVHKNDGTEDIDLLNRELIIDNSAIVNVKGKIVIGGITGQQSNGLCGHTSGKYGQIKNNGIINMLSGSIIDCYGYIIGDGKINTQENVSIYEPFIIGDYAGGTNTALLSADDLNVFKSNPINDNGYTTPFALYALVNIQCELNLTYKSNLYGNSRIWFGTGKKYIDNTIIMIGNTADSFINLLEGSKIKLLYDEEKALQKTCYDFRNVGKTTVVVDGNIMTGAISIKFSYTGVETTIDTNNFVLPIPYNFTINFRSGNSTITNKLAFFPGSELYVASGATLKVDSNASLYIFDKLADLYGENITYFSGSYYLAYPSSIPSKLFVDGALDIDGTFGGIIQTNGIGAVIDVDENAKIDGKEEAKFGSGSQKYTIYEFTGNLGSSSTKQNYYLEGKIFVKNNETYEFITLEKNVKYVSVDTKENVYENYSTTYDYNKVTIVEEEKVVPFVPYKKEKVNVDKWEASTTEMIRPVSVIGSWQISN